MIRKEIVLPATREEVWAALTDPAELESWFANDVDARAAPRAARRGSAGETASRGTASSPRSSRASGSRSAGTARARSSSRWPTTQTAPA